MVASTASNINCGDPVSGLIQRDAHLTGLLRGEVLVETRAHSAWGAAVTAQMYLPLEREKAWQQLIDYPRWVQYFPDISQSRVLSQENTGMSSTTGESKRLYQAASKTFLMLTVQVGVYLRVVETACQQIRFRLESGNFNDFSADLKLKDLANGTLLTYVVQATPTIPIPSMFIQQAIHLDLPANMRRMRQVLCS
ncbi:MAG: cyclase [Leptolyngbyaceae cyanobacterium RU_5_1]|nr:cyclase [Leptolyngbyaceae cyanobacterium RU_5_1]